MNTIPLDTRSFETELRARGCAHIAVVEWAAGRVSDEHAHAFTARGLVLDGEFTLETAAGARRLQRGDIFEVPPGTPHVESVPASGVRILSGRIDTA